MADQEVTGGFPNETGGAAMAPRMSPTGFVVPSKPLLQCAPGRLARKTRKGGDVYVCWIANPVAVDAGFLPKTVNLTRLVDEPARLQSEVDRLDYQQMAFMSGMTAPVMKTRPRQLRPGTRTRRTEEQTTAEMLYQIFSYDPETGKLTRKNGEGTHHKPITDDSYEMRSVGRVQLPAHRIIWCMMTGSWPVYFVDHINNDKRDNRWANLRSATPTENNRWAWGHSW